MVEKPPRKKRQPDLESSWCILLVAENLYVVGGYRPLAVELLKTVVPGGARRFYRTAGPEFFSKFRLNSAQVAWLSEARLFNGNWEVLQEYRRALLNVLSIEYQEIWLVEEGQSRLYQSLFTSDQSETEKYALGTSVVMPLTWARSYTLYCHRHRSWEVHPCKEVGLITERPLPEDSSAKKKKWPDLELHAPQNTLVRASRRQVSYYLTAADGPVRLGRDAEGETASQQVISTQRLALTLRAARAMTGPNS